MTKFAQKERPPQSCSKNCSTVNRHKKLLPSRSLDHSSEKQDLHSKAENALGSSGRLNDSHASSLSDAHFGHNFSQVRVHSSRRTMPTASPLAIGPIQAKLAVSQPGDEYEREADRVAERIIHQTYGTQSQCQTGQCPEFSGKKGEKHQMESTPQRLSVSSFQKSGTINTLSIPSNLEAAIHRARENGGILSDQARRPMERAFGANFAHVKIHTDDESNRLNQMLHARAFTLGQDIFFQRPYNPTSKQGQGLLAHELTHVTQQSKSSFSGQIIQLTPADFIDALYDNLNERIIRDRLINIIRSLESRNLQEARILYARLMTQGGALASRFERRLPTSHEDVLQVLGQRILELEREQREEYAARQTFQYSPRPDEGNASLSPELAQQIERIQQQSRGFQRVASTAPPGGRRESVRAYLQSPTRPAETVEHEEPEEGRQERVAAQQAAERVPESGRPSGQREARVELRSERSEPEEGRQEREVAQQAAVQAAERVPESERPSGQREARVERRNERSDPPQPIIPQSAQESARREERNERGEIIWEDVPDLVGRRLGTGLLAIAIIGLAVGAGIISGGTALIFAADLAAVSWMNSYFERREEIERGGYNVPIPNTAVTAFGDAIGLSQFIQGITGLELGTGRRLSGTERTSNVSTGSADLMLQAGLLIGSRAFRTGRATGQSSAGAPGSGRHQAAIERWQGRFGQAQTEMEMQSVRQRGREHWQQRRRSAGQREISGTRERPGREGLSPPSTTSVSANAEVQAAVELSEGGTVQGINRPALSTTAGGTSRPPPRGGGSRTGGGERSGGGRMAAAVADERARLEDVHDRPGTITENPPTSDRFFVRESYGTNRFGEPEARYYAEAWLDEQGILEGDFMLRRPAEELGMTPREGSSGYVRSSQLRGGTLYRRALEFLRRHYGAIRGLRGRWGAGDNLTAFNRAYTRLRAQGMADAAARQAAAFETFTGGIAASELYTRVHIESATFDAASNEFTEVIVVFYPQ